MSDRRWVIWSEEHGAWWKPGRSGYTRSLIAAGRFSEDEALEIEAQGNRYLKAGALHEAAMSDPMADVAARTPSNERLIDAEIDALMPLIVDLAAEIQPGLAERLRFGLDHGGIPREVTASPQTPIDLVKLARFIANRKT